MELNYSSHLPSRARLFLLYRDDSSWCPCKQSLRVWGESSSFPTLHAGQTSVRLGIASSRKAPTFARFCCRGDGLPSIRTSRKELCFLRCSRSLCCNLPFWPVNLLLLWNMDLDRKEGKGKVREHMDRCRCAFPRNWKHHTRLLCSSGHHFRMMTGANQRISALDRLAMIAGCSAAGSENSLPRRHWSR